MVNPHKHANNLNKDDLEKIYNHLSMEYERARDFHTKKYINQQILVLILLCRRFPVQDMVRIDYDFFESEPSESVLYRHLKEHSKNNYCEIDGLLLTNRQNKALTVDSIGKMLEDIDTGTVDKQLSVNTLNITSSMLNDFGKMNFNKKRIKKYLNLKSRIEVMEEQIQNNAITDGEDNPKISDSIIEGISSKIVDILDESLNRGYSSQDLSQLKEKQDILEDSITNKHNQLSKTISKIHHNIKASNNKFIKFQSYFDEMALIKDSIYTSLEKQDTKIALLEDRFDEIIERLDEMDKNEKMEYIPIEDNCRVDDMMADANANDVDFSDYKNFTFNWFNKNLKITKNQHDVMGLENIITKMDKFLDSQDMQLDRQLLYQRMESYLAYWYNEHNTMLPFKDVKVRSINGNEFYSFLKFINFNEERENRVKNSIVGWLKENTCEVEGAKTYTNEILDKLEPIFLENGWIITDKDEWEQLQSAGFSKVIVRRTFSQIIGKAVQEVYQSISKDTIQRDTPNSTGNITWYPNIQILDRKVSSELHSRISSELSNDIFESDNIIYNWLKNNLRYTSRDEDRVQVSLLRDRVVKHLQVHEIRISQKSLGTVFDSVLKIFLDDCKAESFGDGEIIGFKLGAESCDMVLNIITDWMENHIIITDNNEDKTYLEEINEKILSLLYHKKISVVNDTLYSRIPDELKSNVITQSQFEDNVKTALSMKLGDNNVEENMDGICYNRMQIIKYKNLKEEHIKSWINTNVEELLKDNVAAKEEVIGDFNRYITEHNIKNTTQYGIDELVDVAMDEYYSQVSGISLKLLHDSHNEYYVLITA